MKRIKLLLIVALLTLLGGGALAMGLASVEHGMALFNDRSLGTSGKSCATCHPNGEGLETAGNKANLADTINTCISKPLAGEPLANDSVAMKSLILYIKSLAN